jgi:hypothetical protein
MHLPYCYSFDIVISRYFDKFSNVLLATLFTTLPQISVPTFIIFIWRLDFCIYLEVLIYMQIRNRREIEVVIVPLVNRRRAATPRLLLIAR